MIIRWLNHQLWCHDVADIPQTDPHDIPIGSETHTVRTRSGDVVSFAGHGEVWASAESGFRDAMGGWGDVFWAQKDDRKVGKLTKL
jgi:hypothetical protein